MKIRLLPKVRLKAFVVVQLMVEQLDAE